MTHEEKKIPQNRNGPRVRVIHRTTKRLAQLEQAKKRVVEDRVQQVIKEE